MPGLAQQFRFGALDLGFTRPLIDELTKNVFNWADYSLAPSKLVKKQMQHLGIANVGLWRRGVDAGAFNPAFRSEAMRAEMTQGNPAETVLLYVGRLSQEKQIEHIRPTLEQLSNTRLVVVGDGPARPWLERELADLPVTFMGYPARRTAVTTPMPAPICSSSPRAWRLSAWWLSKQWRRDCLSWRRASAAVSDVVSEGINGYTFESGDQTGLLEGVRRIASDKNRMRWMGQQARAYAETQSWDAIMDEVIEIYGSLIADKAHHAIAV